MNRIEYVNKNNFFRWFDATLDPQPERPIIENGYMYDPFRQSMPVLIPNENYAFYLNFTTNPLTAPADVNVKYKVRLIDANDEFVSDSLGQVSKLILSTIGANYPYHLYCKYFNIGNLGITGVYRLAIVDFATADIIYYISNCVMLQGVEVKEFTNYFQFRQNVNLDNFYYELLPVPLILEPYYQRVRLVINKIGFEFDQDIKQYRRANDRSLRNYRYDTDKIYKLESHWFSEDDHDAAVTMYEHRELYANTIGILQKGDYKATAKTNLNICKAECEVILTGVNYSYVGSFQDDPDFNNDFNDDFNTN